MPSLDSGRHLLKAIRPSPFIYDLITTTFTSILTTITAMAITRILADGLGPEQFGAYQLSRRLLATVTPITTLSIGVALPRYLAMAQDNSTRDSHLIGGLLLGTGPNLLLAAVATLFAGPLARWTFHSGAYTRLFLATLWLIVGYAFFGVLYAFYRGLRRMRPANLWQAVVVGVGPLLVAWLWARSGRADLIIALSGVLMWAAAVPLGYYTFKILARPHSLHLGESMRRLASFGLPRAPAGFALAGLFAIGPFLAPRLGSLRDAGYLAAGQFVFTAVEGGIVAFGLVALPKLAQMVAYKQQTAIREAIENIIALVLHLGLFVALQGEVWADEMVWLLLGPQYEKAIPLIRLMLLALAPYLIYVMLRSVVDAVEEKAVNTLNLFIALAVELVLAGATAVTGLGVIGVAASTTVAFLTLGASTTYYLARAYRIDWRNSRLGLAVLLNLGLAAVAAAAKLGLCVPMTGMPRVAMAIGCTSFLGALYGFILWRLRIQWMVELVRRVMPATTHVQGTT